ncbi:YqjF family protein, partial [Caballeronia sp.]|uniref:YqjF family protein n=1 Tax=Caballeronia sp. TaxID=1931223 RepID=UPI003C671F0E
LYQPTSDAAPRCYVSLVGFLFDKVRVKGLAIPLHTRFEEINLRFYVRRREDDGSVKRGVVFIREFVPRRAIAWIAKRFYEEPYVAIPTRSEISSDGKTPTAKYGWKLGGRWHTLSAAGDLPPQAITPGSEEEFITEHYWGYTKRSNGRISAYQVEHPRWQTYRLQSYEIAVDFGLLYGQEFALLNGTQASSVFLAEGSGVTVHSGFHLR